MSPKTISLIVGLTASGLLGLATRGPAGQEAAPTGSPPSSPSSPSQTVILLSNGRILHGELQEDGAGYVLKQKVGTIRFPKDTVEKTFGSIREVYQYKLGRLPQADPDEHMKLAQWCLSQGLNAEATAQLQEVVTLHPGHAQARAMLQNLALSARRAAPSDPEVARTGVSAAAPGRPEELTSDILAQIRRNQGQVPPTPPVIFDLPPALAVRRLQEFAWYVHPELQRHCAKCHNERSGLRFQLVEAKSRRDLSNHLLVTTNLDATLRLIDPDTPAKSDVLVSAVMPHGPEGRPILSGPNDPSYQRLVTWVNSLKSPQQPAAAVTSSGPAVPAAPTVHEGFASERSPALPREALAPSALTAPAAMAQQRNPVEPARITATHPAVPPDAEFRASPLLGGPVQVPVPVRGQVPSPGAGSTHASPAPATPQTITLPGGEVVPVDTRALSKGDASDASGSSRKKPIHVDPALLEKMLSGKAR